MSQCTIVFFTRGDCAPPPPAAAPPCRTLAAELVPQDGLLVHLVAALDTLGVGQQQRLVRAGRRQLRGLVQLQEHELGRDGARLHHNEQL